eukprot:TRINITY_DN1519_c0_g1_i2.p1 TRINITY_DN1519_c0_g1~~TRINITY_DN1519_c0_g1_i2.p1  ORF type:complete len:140 (-),score=43.39 TRINITY_DN1519_c0_g1_i2:69-488(-)
MQEFTQSGGVRPFGVSLLIAGYDHSGPQLYQVDPSGSFWGWKASAIGKNMPNAKTFLEKRYHEDMELEDAIHTALLTLKEGFEGQMTHHTVEVGIATRAAPSAAATAPPTSLSGAAAAPPVTFRVLTPAQTKDYLDVLG